MGEAETDDFGIRLRAFRHAAGLSQEELAERSGLSIRAISNLERGCTRWPYPASVNRLADALALRAEARAALLATVRRRLSAPAAPAIGVRKRGAHGGGAPRRDVDHQDPVGEVFPAGAIARFGGGPPMTPRRLPTMASAFAGQRDQVTALARLLCGPAGTAVIAVVGGAAGTGKTALALQLAHEVAGYFPDGRLYVDLRGYDGGEPDTAHATLAAFLRAFGVPPSTIPEDAEERAAMYRSLLIGKRVLVILDNARTAEQVRPLLPEAAGCAAVVISRNSLTGLVAREGAARQEPGGEPSGEALVLQLHVSGWSWGPLLARG